MNMLTSLKALLLPGVAPLGARMEDAAAGEGGDFAALMQDAAAPLSPARQAVPQVVAMATPSVSPEHHAPTHEEIAASPESAAVESPAKTAPASAQPAPFVSIDGEAGPVGQVVATRPTRNAIAQLPAAPTSEESAASPESAVVEPPAATSLSSPQPAPFVPIDGEDEPVGQIVVARPTILSPTKNGAAPDRAQSVESDVTADETDEGDTDEAGAEARSVPDKPTAGHSIKTEPSPVALPVAAMQGPVAMDLPAPQIAPPREIAQPAAVLNLAPAGSETAKSMQVAPLSTVPVDAGATEAPLHQATMSDMPEKLPSNQLSNPAHRTVEPLLPTVVAVHPAAPAPVSPPLPDASGVAVPDAPIDGVASPLKAIAQASVKPASAPAAPRRSVTEVLSLLQLARDQLRHGGGAIQAHDAEHAADAPPPARANPEPLALPPLPSAVQMPQAAAQGMTVVPAVDLTATLGAKLVDMSVSGQWIDGLARDIARFSADGAQGRFQIDAGQLGPVQVDIRQSQDGATISLTVASEMAEQALRQESDRLRVDAGLSAVRIADVKIERGHVVAETARADGGQNAASQHPSGQQGQGGWSAQGQHQGWGQSSAQSHMEGRGQGRENFGSGAKAQGEAAVLKSEQAGGNAADLPRARYA
jgi:flagellar hook-length control protein FliK